MPSQAKLDNLYMDIAERIAQMSHSRRLKVGALVVQGRNIISFGYNGTPSGFDNNCEIENPDGTLTTRPEVLHAEYNVAFKLKETNTHGQLNGATLYCTHSPCVIWYHSSGVQDTIPHLGWNRSLPTIWNSGRPAMKLRLNSVIWTIGLFIVVALGIVLTVIASFVASQWPKSFLILFLAGVVLGVYKLVDLVLNGEDSAQK
jgi:pyrimidine deaminase RibD-like protein